MDMLGKRLITTAAAVAGLIAGLGAAVQTASADTFRYGSFVPERSAANQKGVFPLMEKVTKATEGRVEFNRMIGGTVVSAPGALKSISDGVVDAGWILPHLHASDLPYGSLLTEFTGLGTHPLAALGAINEVFFATCPECRKDFAKHNVMPLMLVPASPMVMACTRPVSTAADLDGLRVSALGTAEMRWGAMLGMTPRRQNFAEVVQALQLGQTDCWVTTIGWINSYGLTDTINSVIEMPQGVINGAAPIAFNTRAWERISEADRAVIRRNMPAWARDFIQHAYIDNDAEVKKKVEGKIAFHPGDDALAAKWKEHQDAEVQAIIELAKRRNLDDAERLVTEIAAVYRKWHEEHLPKFGDDPDAFADLLWQEVFSKAEF